MSPLQYLRKSSLIILVSTFYFFISCSQYEIRNRSFDYALYKAFKLQNIEIYKKNAKKTTDNQSSQEALDDINAHYGTNLVLPDNISYALVNIDNVEDLKNYLIAENLLTQEDYEYLADFSEQVKISDFEEGILSYEESVLSENLAVENINQHELFANSMKITNDIEPTLFQENSDYMSRGPWTCALAYFLFFWAVVSLIGGCATLIFCVAAWIGFLSAWSFVLIECGKK